MRLGEKPEGRAGTKDALHIHVIVSTCDQYIEPGDKVIFIEKDLSECRKFDPDVDQDFHGVVDPFTDVVGYECVVLLRPGAATDVRHVFEINFEVPMFESYCQKKNC